MRPAYRTCLLYTSVLHYSRRFVVKQVTLPPEKYPELQRLAGVIAEDEDSKAVLKRAQ